MRNTLKSFFVPRFTLNKKMCNAEVEEIYWTPEGIAVKVRLEDEDDG